MIQNKVTTFMCGIGDEAHMVDDLVLKYTTMKSARAVWEAEVDETRTYIFATDTRRTVQPVGEFANSTTIPKLAQIRNNINTSYEEHLFPNTDWIQWTAEDADSISKDKADAIKSYVRTKAEDSGLESVVSQLVEDWTDTGLCAVETYYAKETSKDTMGNPVAGYEGPRAARIDPNDVVYDVTAADLESAMKCVRSVHTMASLKKLSVENPQLLSQEMFQTIKARREQARGALMGATGKPTYLMNQLRRAGHGATIDMVQRDEFELLTFYGDFYDDKTDTLYANYRIIVLDRAVILDKQPISSFTGKHSIKLAVWERREGTLAPMGPLARIIGLQYKLDKLENIRSDKFDMLANPPLVERGDVQQIGVRGKPGCRYKVEEDGDVRELTESAVALNADTQIQFTLQLMDELAGNPKESIGQRTPGEKTKFEVQLLDAGQNKLFRNKIKRFEKEVLSPILQEYLAIGRQNLSSTDLIRVLDDDLGVVNMTDVTADDIAGRGKLRARGSSIFAQKANALQNIITIQQSVGNLIAPHTSTAKLAKTVEALADLGEYGIYIKGIGIQEQNELKRMANVSADNSTEVDLTEASVKNDPQISNP